MAQLLAALTVVRKAASMVVVTAERSAVCSAEPSADPRDDYSVEKTEAWMDWSLAVTMAVLSAGL